jgi:hypothetical protein
MEKNEVFEYTYHHNVPGEKRFTLCATHEAGVMSFGLALVNPKDHYNKKIGRQKALGRSKMKLPIYRIDDVDDPKEMFYTVANGFKYVVCDDKIINEKVLKDHSFHFEFWGKISDKLSEFEDE